MPMKAGFLAVSAAIALLGGAVAAAAGPATTDGGGAALGTPGGLPSFGGPDTNLGDTAGGPGSGPSFGRENPQDAGFPTAMPQGMPAADDSSLLSGAAGAKK
jgi:hypothetical protein